MQNSNHLRLMEAMEEYRDQLNLTRCDFRVIYPYNAEIRSMEHLFRIVNYPDFSVEEIIEQLIFWKTVLESTRGCVSSVIECVKQNSSSPPCCVIGPATYSAADFAPISQEQERAFRIVSDIRFAQNLDWPSTPSRQRYNCSFCSEKDLENFYTSKRGNIACPKCFKEREARHLAKEKKVNANI
jgi:hypothetical protein